VRFIDYRTMSDQDILSIEQAPSEKHVGDDKPVDHWITKDHHHIPITKSQGNQRRKCPPRKQAFFERLGGIFKQMGLEAQTNPAFIAALSAYESSWLGQHAQSLHNPFGLTAAGGNDLSFPSYEAAAKYWLHQAGREHKGFMSAVKGAKTIDKFAEALRKAGYNAVNSDWSSDVAKVYRTSIAPFLTGCGF